MTDEKHYISRKEVFRPIYTFLRSQGIETTMDKTQVISRICDKYKPDFAKKVLDLWFGVDPKNKISIYYKQDVAFSVDCEELIERIDAKNDIYRSKYDEPLHYKEKLDTKKEFLKAVNHSKKLFVHLMEVTKILIIFGLPLLLILFVFRACESNDKKVNEEIKRTSQTIEQKDKRDTVRNIPKKVYTKKEIEKYPQNKKQEVLKEELQEKAVPTYAIVKKQVTPKPIEKKSQSCTYYYTTSNVRFRSNSNTNSSIRGKIRKSKKICVTKNDDGWMYVKNKGWVFGKFLTSESNYKKTKLRKTKKTKKSKVKKRVDRSVWHCVARSTRASGWVERVGKKNAMRGALRQCEMRRQTSPGCRIVNCYRL